MAALIVFFVLLATCTAVILFTLITRDKKKYEQTTYKKETGNSYWAAKRDKGLNGEYLIVKELDQLTGFHRVLCNAYLPNRRGGTTEVDIILLHETGIYVIESKNYSGWIFGDEKSKNWMQTFPNGRKSFFYNPIKQNEIHRNALKRVLTEVDESVFKSVVVFGGRCQIKKLEMGSSDAAVIYRSQLKFMLEMQSERVLSASQIIAIYQQLRKYTHATELQKLQHITQVKGM